MDLLYSVLVCLGLSLKHSDIGEPDNHLPAAAATDRSSLLSPDICTRRAIDIPEHLLIRRPSRRRLSNFSPPTRKRAKEPPKIIIHCVGHAEAEHNAPKEGQNRAEMHDPPLTDNGVYQCAQLLHTFTIPMEKITHIYSSPSRRCIATTSLAFRPLATEMAATNRKIILWMDLKELADLPCNTGTPIPTLQEEFGNAPIEYSTLPEGWEEIFPSNEYSWKQLAMRIRKALWVMGNDALKNGEVNVNGNVEMLVVSHQGLLAALEGDVNKRANWPTAQHKSFEFLPRQAVLEFNAANPGSVLQPYSMFMESKNNRKGRVDRGELNSWVLMKLGWDAKEVGRLNEIFKERGRKRREMEREREREMTLEREMMERDGEMARKEERGAGDEDLDEGGRRSEAQKKCPKSVRAKGLRKNVGVRSRLPAKSAK